MRTRNTPSRVVNASVASQLEVEGNEWKQTAKLFGSLSSVYSKANTISDSSAATHYIYYLQLPGEMFACAFL